MNNQIPWSKLFSISYHQLKLAPSEFWKLTFSEYLILINMFCDQNNYHSFSKAELESLKSKFPDN